MHRSAGLLPAWDAIPKWWKWYGYINPLRYGYGAVAINGFAGRPDVMLGGLPVRRDPVPMHHCTLELQVRPAASGGSPVVEICQTSTASPKLSAACCQK